MQRNVTKIFTWEDWISEWKRAKHDKVRLGLVHSGFSIDYINEADSKHGQPGGSSTLVFKRLRTYLLTADTKSGYSEEVRKKSFFAFLLECKKQEVFDIHGYCRTPGMAQNTYLASAILWFLRYSPPNVCLINHGVMRLGHLNDWFHKAIVPWLLHQWEMRTSLTKVSTKSIGNELVVGLCLDRNEMLRELSHWVSGSYGGARYYDVPSDISDYKARLLQFQAHALFDLQEHESAIFRSSKNALLNLSPLALFVNGVQEVSKVMTRRSEQNRLLGEKDRLEEQISELAK